MRNQNQEDDDDTPLTKPKKQPKKQEIVVEPPKQAEPPKPTETEVKKLERKCHQKHQNKWSNLKRLWKKEKKML